MSALDSARIFRRGTDCRRDTKNHPGAGYIFLGLKEEKTNLISDCSDFYFSSYEEKTQCGRQFWNVVEREPVETRVLNPTASEASDQI